MTVWLLTEHHSVFLSLKGGCTDLSESTLVKIPHCWKSRVSAHLCLSRPMEIIQCIGLWIHSLMEKWTKVTTLHLQGLKPLTAQSQAKHSTTSALHMQGFPKMFSLIPSDANDPQGLMRR